MEGIWETVRQPPFSLPIPAAWRPLCSAISVALPFDLPSDTVWFLKPPSFAFFEFGSVSAEHSHTQARALIVGWLCEAWSQLRKVMTLTGAASHCDLDKQCWNAVYLWLEVQSARVGDPLDYMEQTCPLMATWYNVMSPSATWTQQAESWPGFISPGDSLFCIVYHALVLFSQLMTAAANIKLTHTEKDFR